MGFVGQIADQRVGYRVPKARNAENKPHDSRRDEQHISRKFHQVKGHQAEHIAGADGRYCETD